MDTSGKILFRAHESDNKNQNILPILNGIIKKNSSINGTIVLEETFFAHENPEWIKKISINVVPSLKAVLTQKTLEKRALATLSIVPFMVIGSKTPIVKLVGLRIINNNNWRYYSCYWAQDI